MPEQWILGSREAFRALGHLRALAWQPPRYTVAARVGQQEFADERSHVAKEQRLVASAETTRLDIGLAVMRLSKRGGKERDALAIAEGLTKRGHRVTILTSKVGLNVPDGAKVKCIPSKQFTNHGRAQAFARAIAEEQRAARFDVLLSFEKIKEADAYYVAAPCFAQRKLGVKAWLPRYRTYRHLEERCFGPGGPHILFLSSKQMEEYASVYRLEDHRVTTLPPMIHPSTACAFYASRTDIRHSLGITPNALLAASVALYPRTKGVDRTIRALREIPGLHLLVAGLEAADVMSLKKMASRAGVANRVFLSGYRDDIAELLGAADLLLHPAREEATGLIIVEGMLAGLPVIASAHCGYGSYVHNFQAGFLIAEPFENRQFVALIRDALAPNTLAELKAHARQGAVQLRAEGGVDPIVDAIESVLVRRHQIKVLQGQQAR